MLRADAHESPDVIQVVLEHVVAIDCRKTFGRSKHACKHRDHGRLASTIMPQQGKDLTLVHAHINASNRLHAVSKRFRQVVNLEQLLLLLEVNLVDPGRLKILFSDVARLEFIINLVFVIVSILVG